ncbi:MAG: hypothetical protein Wins2KO_29680 [Winogradskyella sp.]
MKTKFLKLSVFTFFLLVFLACNDAKNSCEIEQAEIESLTKKLDSVVKMKSSDRQNSEVNILSSIRRIKQNEVQYYDYNYQIVNNQSKLTDDTMELKVPVSNENFRHHNTFDISSSTRSAILYHISDGTIDERSNNPITHILEDNLYNTILNDVIKNDSVIVLVINDNSTDFNANRSAILNEAREFIATGVEPTSISLCEAIKTADFDKFRPQEACGGIIVK